MARKKKQEEHVNHERWLVSYADFITLLFAFFVVMYATSIVDKKRLDQVAGSIRWALHMEGTGGSVDPGAFVGSPSMKDPFALVKMGQRSDAKERHRIVTERLALAQIKERIEERLNSGVGAQLLGDALQIMITEKGLRIRLLQSYFFDVGSSRIRPEAIPVIDAIASILAPLENHVRIEGHTDGKKSPDPMTNWRLSADRSLAMMNYFVKGTKMRADRLWLAAFAEHRPIASNKTEEGQALNRRIDLFVFSGAPSYDDS